MLDKAIIESLINLKTSEKVEIGEYKIEFFFLTLDHIINYQKELDLLKDKNNKANLIKFITDADRLTEQVLKIEKKNQDTYEKVSIRSLVLPLAITILGEWIELNFTQLKTMIEPLELMLTRLTGKKIDLKSLLANLSAVLSTAGTSTEKESSDSLLENSTNSNPGSLSLTKS